jgi:hypothetical protein
MSFARSISKGSRFVTHGILKLWGCYWLGEWNIADKVLEMQETRDGCFLRLEYVVILCTGHQVSKNIANISWI